LAIAIADMRPPLRIAILECGEPSKKTRETIGGYGEIFRILLEKGSCDLNEPMLSPKDGLDLTYWGVEKEDKYPKLDDIDAVLLTGSSRSDCTMHHKFRRGSNSRHRA
jgi:hypothetical protein